MTEPVRHVVYEASMSLAEMNAGHLDLRPLQVAFAELFDRIAEGVHHAGLDADDVVLERRLLVRIDAQPPSWQPIEYLSSPDLYATDLLQKLRRDGLEIANLSGVYVLAARVTAYAEGVS